MAEQAALVASEVAANLPMPLHRLDVDDDGHARWTCDAPVGAPCRLVCAEDCGAEQWPCNSYDGEGEEIQPAHPMRDDGECHVVLFLALGEPMESYEGGEPEPFDLRSGVVEVEWEGDYYGWSYAQAAAREGVSE